MLSDEEEILIKKLRYCEQEYEQNGYLSVGKFKAIKEASNLIEKQSKEIEKLNKSDLSKEQSSMKYYNLYKELVDKIKAKIEELDEKSFKNNINYTEFYYKKEVLQSLLEKE